MNPCTLDTERAERMLMLLSELCRLNKRMPIIVEGRRDVNALRRLGLEGPLITINNGESLYEFCESVLNNHSEVILLTDWDHKGEALFRNISTHLSGIWETFAYLRESIKALCQKDIQDVEGIPSLLYRIYGRETTIGEYEQEEKLKGNR